MRIQIITGNKNWNSSGNITISDYSNPMSPDNYDVNIVDLAYSGLWNYNGSLSIGKLNMHNDLRSIAKMIDGSVKSKVVYVYPQDENYKYDYYGNGYQKHIRVKDLITSGVYQQDYKECFPSHVFHPVVVFEPTKTVINNLEYTSAFRFAYDYETVVTRSESSNKPTTIKTENGIVFTTLDICSSTEKTVAFIEAVLEDKKLSDVPVWVHEFEFGNDSKLKETIALCKKQIVELQQEIDDANDELDQNNRYKSILVTNSDALVEVVFDVLEKILDCDLSGFVDEKREDFRIEKDNLVIIGEIKGITSNVKNENISQLDVHYQSYLDKMENTHLDKKVISILIINPLRNKKIDEREPVNERQIELAKRNGSLIIETVTLLKMFELFTNGVLSSERCIKILEEKTGILTIDDLQTSK